MAPDPVGQGVIDQGDPDEAKKQEGLKTHPLHEGPGDQGRSDPREHHLEGGEEPLGDRLGVIGIGGHAHPGQSQVVEAADDPPDIPPKGQGVTVPHPLDSHQGREGEAQGQGGKDVFPPHHAPVKQGQGRGHQRHQGAAHQDPGRIT